MKFILISLFLVGFFVKINLINSLPVFGEIYTEKKIVNYYLANKYCDSLEKNLFKGLDKESTLKYEYFFSSIPDNYIKDKNKFQFYVLDFLETIGTAFLIAVFIKEFIMQVSVVPTGSMIPTMIGGKEGTFNDRLFVNKIIYSVFEPKRGDIVVFSSPAKDGKDYVKRLIGEPGDTIEIKKGYVFI